MRDSSIIGRIAQIVNVTSTSVIDHNNSANIIDQPQPPMTPSTDSCRSSPIPNLQILKETLTVSTNVNHEVSMTIDNNDVPSSLLDWTKEQEATLQVFSNGWEQQQYQCSVEENMTLTSNFNNDQEDNEVSSRVDDVSNILEGNDLIKTINYADLLDLLPGLLQ